jgi:phosphoserine/homoserine phosphotransferase
MHLVCLDLEGVLIPEIWIAFSKATGIPELMRTTREESDYDKLMAYRLDILNRENLKLVDIQKVIAKMDVLEGARECVDRLKEKTQLIILSDTFLQFAQPLMKKLGYPTLFCNSLIVDGQGHITGWKLRQSDGKRHAVQAFKSINMKVFAAGDSYNDLSMIQNAHAGALFRAPESIVQAFPDLPALSSYNELLGQIDEFLTGPIRDE